MAEIEYLPVEVRSKSLTTQIECIDGEGGGGYGCGNVEVAIVAVQRRRSPRLLYGKWRRQQRE